MLSPKNPFLSSHNCRMRGMHLTQELLLHRLTCRLPTSRDTVLSGAKFLSLSQTAAKQGLEGIDSTGRISNLKEYANRSETEQILEANEWREDKGQMPERECCPERNPTNPTGKMQRPEPVHLSTLFS